MDNYMLFLVLGDKKINITKYISSLNWKNSLGALGTELSFSVVRKSTSIDAPDLDYIKVGTKLLLTNGENEIFRGIIVTLGTELLKQSITALDFAFYLNKSKTIKQFRDVSASLAISSLLSEFRVPVGEIVNIPTNITKIYKGNTVAEIIIDILKQATDESSIKYRLEMRAGKVHIMKYEKLLIKPTFQRAINIEPLDISKSIAAVTKQESIVEMKNSIIAEKSEGASVQVDDEISIKEFGLLQEVISIDDKDSSKARNIAKNTLKELNKVTESIEVQLLGSDLLNSGRIIDLDEAKFDLVGPYLIKACSHTYQNSIHKASVTLERYIS